MKRFKNILPLLALVAVVAFSSFTTISKHQPQKALADSYFLYNDGAPSGSSENDVLEICTGNGALCGYAVPSGTDLADAQEAAEQAKAQNATPGTPTVITLDEGQQTEREITVTIWLKP